MQQVRCPAVSGREWRRFGGAFNDGDRPEAVNCVKGGMTRFAERQGL